MPDGEVTLGELARSLAAMESRVNEKFTTVNQRLDNLQFVPRREFEIQIKALGEDVRELRESKQWMQRTLVASFLFPVAVAVVIALVVTR